MGKKNPKTAVGQQFLGMDKSLVRRAVYLTL